MTAKNHEEKSCRTCLATMGAVTKTSRRSFVTGLPICAEHAYREMTTVGCRGAFDAWEKKRRRVMRLSGTDLGPISLPFFERWMRKNAS